MDAVAAAMAKASVNVVPINSAPSLNRQARKAAGREARRGREAPLMLQADRAWVDRNPPQA